MIQEGAEVRHDALGRGYVASQGSSPEHVQVHFDNGLRFYLVSAATLDVIENGKGLIEKRGWREAERRSRFNRDVVIG